MLACSSDAQAIPLKQIPPIHIYIVEVLGDKGYSEELGLEVAIFAVAKLNKHLNLKLIITGYETREEKEKVSIDFSERQNQLKDYESEFEDKRFSFADLILVITPPLWNDSDFFMGGLSSSICRFEGSAYGYHGRRVSVVNIEPDNPQGLSRHNESVVDVEHELLHLLGAEHVTTTVPDMMDDAAMRFASEFPIGEVPIGAITKNQLRLCFDSPRARRKFHLSKKTYNEFTGK